MLAGIVFMKFCAAERHANTYMHIYTHAYTCTHIHIYMHMHVYMHTDTDIKEVAQVTQTFSLFEKKKKKMCRLNVVVQTWNSHTQRTLRQKDCCEF